MAGRRVKARRARGSRHLAPGRPPRCLPPALSPLGALTVLLTVLTLVAAACGQAQPDVSPTPTSTSASAAVKVVGVFQYGPDPSTQQAYDGLVAALAERGYVDGGSLRIDFRDCGGDLTRIDAVAGEFAAAGLDAVVPLTTPCLVAAAEAVREAPVVFTSVYDPFAAGVAVSPSDHQANLTGVYSPPPVAATVDLVLECVPGTRVIATVYDASQANTRSAVAEMTESCRQKGVRLVKVRVATAAEVGPALADLFSGARARASDAPQALYITGDNTVVKALDDIVAACRRAGVPLFLNDPGFVAEGAVAGLGPDFDSAGRAGGQMLADVLDGADPATMDLQRDTGTVLAVNEAAAKAVGLELPATVLERAAQQ